MRNYTDYEYHCLNNRVLKLEVGQTTALFTPQSGKPPSALAICVSFQSPGETATLVQIQRIMLCALLQTTVSALLIGVHPRP